MIVDMSPTSVGRFIATALATGWLITSSVKQEPPGVSDPRASGARPTAAEMVPAVKFTGKMNDRMRETPVPQPGRNPFVYGARPPVPRDDAPVAAEPVAMTPAPPVEPPQPVFKLSGIAASQKDGLTVLTAIVIDNGVMVFAKAGDKLSNGYSVVSVEEGAITLIDANGVTQTLRLP
jgi:hypothetical protein